MVVLRIFVKTIQNFLYIFFEEDSNNILIILSDKALIINPNSKSEEYEFN